MNSEGTPISISSAWNKLHEVHACVHMEPVIGDVYNQTEDIHPNFTGHTGALSVS